MNPATFGRMAFVKALTVPSEITFLMEKSFKVFKKPGSSWESGLSITTMSGHIVR